MLKAVLYELILYAIIFYLVKYGMDRWNNYQNNDPEWYSMLKLASEAEKSGDMMKAFELHHKATSGPIPKGVDEKQWNTVKALGGLRFLWRLRGYGSQEGQSATSLDNEEMRSLVEGVEALKEVEGEEALQSLGMNENVYKILQAISTMSHIMKYQNITEKFCLLQEAETLHSIVNAVDILEDAGFQSHLDGIANFTRIRAVDTILQCQNYTNDEFIKASPLLVEAMKALESSTGFGSTPKFKLLQALFTCLQLYDGTQFVGTDYKTLRTALRSGSEAAKVALPFVTQQVPDSEKVQRLFSFVALLDDLLECIHPLAKDATPGPNCLPKAYNELRRIAPEHLKDNGSLKPLKDLAAIAAFYNAVNVDKEKADDFLPSAFDAVQAIDPEATLECSCAEPQDGEKLHLMLDCRELIESRIKDVVEETISPQLFTQLNQELAETKKELLELTRLTNLQNKQLMELVRESSQQGHGLVRDIKLILNVATLALCTFIAAWCGHLYLGGSFSGTSRSQINKKFPSAPPVFISHTGQDATARNFAAHLSEKMHQEDVAYFYDARSIPPGDMWKETIRKAVEECSVLVAILSPRYFQRYWCMHELDLALTSNRPVVPIYYAVSEPKDLPNRRDEFFEWFKDDGRVQNGELDRWWTNISQTLPPIQGIRKSSFENRKDADLLVKEEVFKSVQRYVLPEEIPDPSSQGIAC